MPNELLQRESASVSCVSTVLREPSPRLSVLAPGLPSVSGNSVPRQARYWIGTIPRDDWTPELPSGAQWIKGQPELGESGYRHWQLLVSFAKKVSLVKLRSCLPGTGHYEPTRSAAAEAYVHKEETRDGEPFEFGTKCLNRNSAHDWDAIRTAACSGQLTAIPSDIFIRYYGALRRIAGDYSTPTGIEREVSVYYGPTGTGKSRRAWDESLLGGHVVYAKDPRTKFWCGYRGEDRVIIDEFRGGIDIAHLLRWFDRYPVSVETKGSSIALVASRIWITSNLHPDQWYPELDSASYLALERRITIINMV